MGSSVRVISTKDFWTLLCDPRTYRMSRMSAARGPVIYVTLEAPEDVPGFIDGVIGECRGL